MLTMTSTDPFNIPGPTGIPMHFEGRLGPTCYLSGSPTSPWDVPEGRGHSEAVAARCLAVGDYSVGNGSFSRGNGLNANTECTIQLRLAERPSMCMSRSSIVFQS